MTRAGLPGIAVLALGLLLFFVALVVARSRQEAETGARRDTISMAGIALQGAGFAIVLAGGARVTLDPLGAPALIEAALTAALMGGALALFVWASAAMGRNWSLVARTRADHALVTHGPFAHVRHPIYVAMAFILLAMAVATGHVPRLIAALPVFAIGTWLRVRIEERLLAAMFAADYVAYAARVKRFVPGAV